MAKLTLSVNGTVYGGWKYLSIKRSIRAISASYSFGFSDMWTGANEPWPINTQDDIEVRINNAPLIRGFVEILNGELSDNDRQYTVQGRDATGDLIDCSAPQDTSSWANGISILNLANLLSKGMQISFAWGEGIEPKHQKALPFNLERGETIFDALDRMASRLGIIMIPDGKGGILFTIRGSKRTFDNIVEGSNAKNFSFEKNTAERYSDYIVEGVTNKVATGQASGWDGAKQGAATSLPRSVSKDPNIRRYRPIYLQRHGSNDSTTIDEFASTEAQIRAGQSLTLSCTVQGWVQSNGEPWMINRVVQVNAPRLGIGSESGDEYIIGETEFTLDSTGGAITRLGLLPPDAFLKQKNVDRKKRDQKGQGLGWNSAPGPRPKSMPPLGTSKL